MDAPPDYDNPEFDETQIKRRRISESQAAPKDPDAPMEEGELEDNSNSGDARPDAFAASGPESDCVESGGFGNGSFGKRRATGDLDRSFGKGANSMPLGKRRRFGSSAGDGGIANDGPDGAEEEALPKDPPADAPPPDNRSLISYEDDLFG
ncbi:hypothetical protein AAVH_38718 [Aphelenchoides avenae]|nr:hypothetical protein AAVH_38718 [Aphelenchus avenae]